MGNYKGWISITDTGRVSFENCINPDFKKTSSYFKYKLIKTYPQVTFATPTYFLSVLISCLWPDEFKI